VRAQLFAVHVDGMTFTAARATDAWEQATRRKLRERKKLKVHANEGQCDNVAEMFMACSYAIDGDYMFGVTCTPVARMLEAVKEATSLFNYHPRFDLWGKNHVRENPSGCARGEEFKRRKKMSTAKVQRNAEEGDPAEESYMSKSHKERESAASMRHMYYSLIAEPRTQAPAPPRPAPPRPAPPRPARPAERSSGRPARSGVAARGGGGAAPDERAWGGRVQVRRSAIHNFGLFATQDIAKHDMVIEYVGELVRHIVGDMRDDVALEKGKSTYMFRIDDEYIVRYRSPYAKPYSTWGGRGGRTSYARARPVPEAFLWALPVGRGRRRGGCSRAVRHKPCWRRARWLPRRAA
jgi:hypothetical protein